MSISEASEIVAGCKRLEKERTGDELVGSSRIGSTRCN